MWQWPIFVDLFVAGGFSVILMKRTTAKNILSAFDGGASLSGAAVLFLLVGCGGGDAHLPDRVDFNFDVKPILSDRCFTCHGPDANARQANLRLDTEAGAFAALDSDPERVAIVPGHAANSVLVERTSSTDPTFMMPPPECLLKMPLPWKLWRKWIRWWWIRPAH